MPNQLFFFSESNFPNKLGTQQAGQMHTIYAICIGSCDILFKTDLCFLELQPYSKKWSSSASRIVFPDNNCKQSPFMNFLVHFTHHFGVWEEVLEAILALLLLTSDCAKATLTQSVFCPRGMLWIQET